MSRTYRTNGYAGLYRNLESYLKSRRCRPDEDMTWDIDYYKKSFRDNNTEHWKSDYRECTHRTLRRADKRLIHKIKADPDVYENMVMSHKYCVDIWGWT